MTEKFTWIGIDYGYDPEAGNSIPGSAGPIMTGPVLPAMTGPIPAPMTGLVSIMAASDRSKNDRSDRPVQFDKRRALAALEMYRQLKGRLVTGGE